MLKSFYETQTTGCLYYVDMTSGHAPALSPPTVLHIDSVITLFILLSVLCVGDQRGQKKDQ